MFLYQIYPVIILLHILSAVIWLGFFPVEIYLINSIKKESNTDFKKNQIQKLLTLTNLTGMIGAIGIIITGILLVLISPLYNFFEFKANHWLTTKQFIILIILLIIFAVIIPLSKKIKNFSDTNSNEFKRFVRWAYIEKTLVLINFLLAFFHRYFF